MKRPNLKTRQKRVKALLLVNLGKAWRSLRKKKQMDIEVKATSCIDGKSMEKS
ncbi:hypothetical protein QQ045_014314 [Rhodiola kirilowii]